MNIFGKVKLFFKVKSAGLITLAIIFEDHLITYFSMVTNVNIEVQGKNLIHKIP